MKRSIVLAVALGALVAGLVVSSTVQARQGANTGCGKFNGTVVLTYSNPQTIILHIIKGKVNAATTFTMTPTTTYLRNGVPASFVDIKLGDTGSITATEQLRAERCSRAP